MTTRMNPMAIWALTTSALVVGCAPGGRGHVASLSAYAPSAGKVAAQFAAMGETAMRARNGPLAVAMAERAVASQPGVARYRAQLGQSYLLAGRFASAVDAFRDAIAIAPGDGRAMLGMALGQAALDRQPAARAAVAAADGRIGVVDRGLALALAGDSDGAIALLEPEARRPGAEPRTRQNLALAYALAGRWDAARAVAAQDLPADRVDARMQVWAALARPQPRVARVAAFLGVTPALVDVGMPAQLALGAVEQAPPARAVAVAMSDVQPVPVPVPVQDRPAAPTLVRVSVPAPVPATVPMVTQGSPVRPRLVATESAVASSRPPVSRATPITTSPSAAVPMRVADVMPAERQAGWAVQLGAYSSRRSIEDGWDRIRRTLFPVADMVPLSSIVRTVHGVFWRLAVGGLDSRAAAVTLCGQVRAARGACFVRPSDGAVPMRMALTPRNDGAAV